MHRWFFVLVTLLLVLLLLLPLFSLLVSLKEPLADHEFQFLVTMLPTYLLNTTLLTIGVGVLALFLGVSTAWLVTYYQFPGSTILSVALLFPLAMPSYILAMTYSYLLCYAGPVQTFLRKSFGWSKGDYWFIDIHSLLGAVIVLSIALYPYVFLLARRAFLQSSELIAISQSMGKSSRFILLRVVLPFTRPMLVAGLSLVLMEVLGDFGTVDILAVDTFTTGIKRSWEVMGSYVLAAKLASILLLGVFVALSLEHYSRKQALSYASPQILHTMFRRPLLGVRGYCMLFICSIPVLFGLVIPIIQLSLWGVYAAFDHIQPYFMQDLYHSLTLASITCCTVLAVATVLAVSVRICPTPFRGFQLLVRFSTLGYAIPGFIVGTGIVLCFGYAEPVIRYVGMLMGYPITRLVLIGSLAGIVYAYTFKFLTIGFYSTQSSLQVLPTQMDDQARLFGIPYGRYLTSVILPTLRPTFLSVGLLVFIDCIKELPTILLLRPFDYDTLSTRTFLLASDERVVDAAIPALCITLTGMIAVVMMNYSRQKMYSAPH